MLTHRANSALKSIRRKNWRTRVIWFTIKCNSECPTLTIWRRILSFMARMRIWEWFRQIGLQGTKMFRTKVRSASNSTKLKCFPNRCLYRSTNSQGRDKKVQRATTLGPNRAAAPLVKLVSIWSSWCRQTLWASTVTLTRSVLWHPLPLSMVAWTSSTWRPTQASTTKSTLAEISNKFTTLPLVKGTHVATGAASDHKEAQAPNLSKAVESVL